MQFELKPFMSHHAALISKPSLQPRTHRLLPLQLVMDPCRMAAGRLVVTPASREHSFRK